MASKKTATKRATPKTPKVKVLIELSRRARREVETLLRRSEAGTITMAEMKAGLKQAEAPLKQMLGYINNTLDDVSKLLKRTESKTINLKEFNAKLNVVRKQVKGMLNHTNGFH